MARHRRLKVENHYASVVVTERRDTPSFLSTSVVAKMFGVKQSELRAMIDRGTLPEPDWIRAGTQTERIYSLEWLALASERVNALRLPGFDRDLIVPPDGVQISLRFDRTTWNASEVVRIITGLDGLWAACVRALDPEVQTDDIPSLTIRRMSAGSPFDLLAWARDIGGLAIGVGGAASLLRFILKHPDSIPEAIPRMMAAWIAGWAKVDSAKLERLQSRQNLTRFVAEAESARQRLGQVPDDVNVSGQEISNLESIAPVHEVEEIPTVRSATDEPPRERTTGDQDDDS